MTDVCHIVFEHGDILHYHDAPSTPELLNPVLHLIPIDTFQTNH